MKKVNFNQLEHFEIPEEWMEKALNAQPKKKPILLRPRVLAAAASVVLVTVTALLLLGPFRSFTPPVSVKETRTTSPTATPGATVSATENTAIAATAQPATQPDVTQPDVTQPIDPVDEPSPTEWEDDPSKFRIRDMWYVDTREVRPDSLPAMNDTPLQLDESELYTGDITVIVTPDSPFYGCDVVDLTVSVTYAGQTIEGLVYLEPKEGDNGEKSVTFNPFDEGSYVPAASDYSFRFYYYNDEGQVAQSKTVTAALIADQSVTITI